MVIKLNRLKIDRKLSSGWHESVIILYFLCNRFRTFFLFPSRLFRADFFLWQVLLLLLGEGILLAQSPARPSCRTEKGKKECLI